MQTADIAAMLATKKYFANFLGLISIIGPSSSDFIDFEKNNHQKGLLDGQ
tara:strand:+ start:820 stop:969 length:150 start_codon:yes stop_codon:yes gene_type:complete